MPSRILYLYDEKGTLAGVQIDADLWNRSKHLITPLLQASGSSEPLHALEDFKKFMDAWDFGYAYDPSVTCPACHNSTADWRQDEDPGFSLHNANIGGLLVFHCNKCGATIRHKYFRDHMDMETDG